MAKADPNVAWFGFTGMIEPAGVGRIAGALNAAVNGGVETVHLSFSSNGGYVADGIYLHNHIRALPLHLVIYNTGAEVMLSPTPVNASTRPRILAALRPVKPTGDTCISCGVETSMRLLGRQTGAVSRILLENRRPPDSSSIAIENSIPGCESTSIAKAPSEPATAAAPDLDRTLAPTAAVRSGSRTIPETRIRTLSSTAIRFTADTPWFTAEI